MKIHGVSAKSHTQQECRRQITGVQCPRAACLSRYRADRRDLAHTTSTQFTIQLTEQRAKAAQWYQRPREVAAVLCRPFRPGEAPDRSATGARRTSTSATLRLTGSGDGRAEAQPRMPCAMLVTVCQPTRSGLVTGRLGAAESVSNGDNKHA